MSAARGGGLIAGFIGNPSLLAFADSRAADERINEGYATLFAIDQVIKVVLVQVIVGIGLAPGDRCDPDAAVAPPATASA